MDFGDRQGARSINNQRVCRCGRLRRCVGDFFAQTSTLEPGPRRLPAQNVRRKGRQSEGRGGTPKIFADASSSEKEHPEGESKALISDEKTAENLENEFGARSHVVNSSRPASCAERAPAYRSGTRRRYKSLRRTTAPCGAQHAVTVRARSRDAAAQRRKSFALESFFVSFARCAQTSRDCREPAAQARVATPSGKSERRTIIES